MNEFMLVKIRQVPGVQLMDTAEDMEFSIRHPGEMPRGQGKQTFISGERERVQGKKYLPMRQLHKNDDQRGCVNNDFRE